MLRSSSLRRTLRYAQLPRFVCGGATTARQQQQQQQQSQQLSEALEPASKTDGTTSRSTTPAVFAAPLSDTTLAEFRPDASGALWDELMEEVSQPGVCNLGMGFPDYAGSRLAREAVSAAMVEPTMVLIFNPAYPWYANAARVAGATPVLVELHGPEFAPDMEEVEKAITPKTRVLLLNSPHNPCGHCYTKKELEGFARLALKYNLFIISDEVYENTTFGEIKHLRMADEEGMFERTITLCSASKLYGLTGWRVGWGLSTPELLEGLAVYKGSMSFCGPSPLQHGLSVALEAEDGSFEGGHFLVVDTTPLGLAGLECTRLMLKHAKVGVIPGIIFYLPEEGKELDRPYLRLAICKRRETIEEVVRRIRAMEFPPKNKTNGGRGKSLSINMISLLDRTASWHD